MNGRISILCCDLQECLLKLDVSVCRKPHKRQDRGWVLSTIEPGHHYYHHYYVYYQSAYGAPHVAVNQLWICHNIEGGGMEILRWQSFFMVSRCATQPPCTVRSTGGRPSLLPPQHVLLFVFLSPCKIPILVSNPALIVSLANLLLAVVVRPKWWHGADAASSGQFPLPSVWPRGCSSKRVRRAVLHWLYMRHVFYN